MGFELGFDLGFDCSLRFPIQLWSPLSKGVRGIGSPETLNNEPYLESDNYQTTFQITGFDRVLIPDFLSREEFFAEDFPKAFALIVADGAASLDPMGNHRSIHVELVRQLRLTPPFQRQRHIQRLARNRSRTRRRTNAFPFGPSDDASESSIAHPNIFQSRF